MNEKKNTFFLLLSTRAKFEQANDPHQTSKSSSADGCTWIYIIMGRNHFSIFDNKKLNELFIDLYTYIVFLISHFYILYNLSFFNIF